jgi:hypothetical protein
MTPQPIGAKDTGDRHSGWLFAVLVSLAIVLPIAAITETNPGFVLSYGEEDGVAEYLTALFFFGSGLGFLALYRQSARQFPLWRGLVILAWAALMFFFTGEELSWGQRIAGIETPESVRQTNAQNEFNLHNHDIIQDHGHRILTAFTLITGVGIWLLSLVPPIGRLYRQFLVPIPPLGYAILFVGAFVYGRRYIPSLDYFATEFRELFMACGMLLFAWHGRWFGSRSVLLDPDS